MRLEGRVLFSLMLLVFVIVLAMISLDYNPRARLIPLMICVTLACLLSVQLVADVRKARRHKSVCTGKTSLSEKPGTQGTGTKPISLLRIVLWLVGLITGLAYVNYLFIIPTFLFLFTWWEGNIRVVYALTIAAITGAFYYFLFYLFLGITLPR
jgi:hypothetical protein